MVRSRLFLDANVLFSAAWRADSGLVRLWRLGARTRLLTSPFAIEEARRNLDDTAAAMRLTQLLEDVDVVADVTGALPPEAEGLPEKDIPIVLAALSAAATHLVTGDHRHFARWLGGELAGLKVVTPRQVLDELAGTRPRRGSR